MHACKHTCIGSYGIYIFFHIHVTSSKTCNSSHAYRHTYIHTCIHVDAHLSIHPWIHTCIHIHARIHISSLFQYKYMSYKIYIKCTYIHCSCFPPVCRFVLVASFVVFGCLLVITASCLIVFDNDSLWVS